MPIRSPTKRQSESSILRVLFAAGAALVICSSVSADPLGAGSGTIFRLTPVATYQDGCFPPCLCPILDQQPIRGTLKFIYAGQIEGIETYNIEDVNWIVPFVEGRRLTGAGTYEIGSSNPITVLEQRMQLALRVGDGPVEHFDSGWVPYAFNNAGNVHITIFINGMFCWDRVVVVDANRVLPQDIQQYRLLQGSTYHHDCFGMCDCYTGDLRPMTGDFALVRLDENPLLSEFAVVDARWTAISPSWWGTTTLAGAGFYRVGGEFAVQQQMTLDLLVTDGGGGVTEPIQFDSGLVVGGGAFPHIDIEVPQRNVYNLCAGTILHVIADPDNAEVCGGIAGIPCPTDKFCKLPVGACCCDHFGLCAPIPDACPEYYAPVCGCDGVTYSNECFADAAAVSIAHFGPCETVCRPADNGQGCMPAPCSDIPEVRCIGTILHLDVHTGAITTLACDCLDFNVCHIEFGNASPFAVGNCPHGGACHVIATDTDGDGVDDIFRAECDSIGACCTDMGGSPLPVPVCTEVPADICMNAGVFLGAGTTCGPVEACCIFLGGVTGYCVEASRQCCIALGGEPQGPSSFCGDPTVPNLCSRFCGGFTGVTCDAGEFCKFPEGICSDVADHAGVCTPIPSVCPDVWDPVCGCDGVTYGNECAAGAAAVSILRRGPCEGRCGHPNDPPCADGQFCKLPIGVCGATNLGGYCAPIPGACITLWDPVCGCDGVTYGNECEADRAGIPIAHYGPCTNACAAVRRFDASNVADSSTYCPGEEETILIEMHPPATASAIALEDSPPIGWRVTNISDGGFYDAVNNKVKWGPFFAPFPAGVFYTVVPDDVTGGVECFTGAVSVDGVNQPICGDACLQPCCPHIPPDSAQPACADCPMSGCNHCNGAACEDGQVSLCEVIGYACAWLRGCNDDLSGMTWAAYLWRNGECYCWSGATQNWEPAACGDATCCGNDTIANPSSALSGSEVAAESVSASVRPMGAGRGERGRRLEVEIALAPPVGVSAVAIELSVPKNVSVIEVDGGYWDDVNRKAKWGPFLDDASHALTVTLQTSSRVSVKSSRLSGFQGVPHLTGTVSFDGVNHSFKISG